MRIIAKHHVGQYWLSWSKRLSQIFRQLIVVLRHKFRWVLIDCSKFKSFVCNQRLKFFVFYWNCFFRRNNFFFELFLLLLVQESFNINDVVELIILLFTTVIALSGCIRSLLISLSNNAFSNCFFHQVNFRLSDKFHVTVCERNQHFLNCLSLKFSDSSWARYTSDLLCWRKN